MYILKIKKFIFLVIIILSFSTSSLYAITIELITTEQLKTYMTTIVEARLGDIVPTPVGLAYDLGKAAPGLSKTAIILHVNKLQNNLATKYTDTSKLTPLQKEEIGLREQELQDIMTAVTTGDNTGLIKTIKKKKELEKRIKQAQKDKEKEDDIDTINLFTKLYRNELIEIREKIYNHDSCITRMHVNIYNLYSLNEYIIKELMLIKDASKTGFDVCEAGKLNSKKIIELSDYIKEEKEQIENKISSAKQRASKCETSQDEAFIRSNYNAARNHLAELEILYKKSESQLELLALKLNDIQKINDYLKASQIRADIKKYYKISSSIRACKRTINSDFPKIKQNINRLKKIATDDYNYYKDTYPKETAELKNLIDDIDNLYNLYTRTKKKSKEYIKEYDDFPLSNFPSREVTIKNYIRCIKLSTSGEKVKKAGKDYTYARNLVQSNSSLLSACKKRPPAQIPPTTTPSNTNNNADTNTPPIPSLNITGVTSTQSSSPGISGGLVISGPRVIYVGDGVAFTAVDAAGKPYSKGSFVWINTRQDILSLGTSGNPVSGVGYKPGKFTIKLNYGGWYAYLDGVIKERKKKDENGDKNIFSIAGVQENSDKPGDKNAIFSISGVEEELASDNNKNSRCEEYRLEAIGAYRSGNLDAAQSLINRANGCGKWTQEAQVELDRKRQKLVCERVQANLQAACDSKNAQAISAVQAEANNKNCQIDQSLWQLGTNIINDHNERVNRLNTRQNQGISNNQPSGSSAERFLGGLLSGLQGIQREQQRTSTRDRDINRNNRATPTQSRPHYRGSTCPKQNPGSRGSYRFDNNNNPNDETYISCSYFPDGALRVQTPIKRGKKDGLQITYGTGLNHNEHPVSTKITYKNGKKNGPAEYYTWCKKNGRVINYLGSTVYYSNDRKTGEDRTKESPCYKRRK